MSGIPATGQYAEVNGINLYFETHGTGRPLILLHGGLASSEMFAPILPALAERHQVFAVDLQGHGRTADIDRPIDVRLMADDIAALIDHLGLDQPDIAGYSLGGGVAMHTAAKYPSKVGRLVVASAFLRPDVIDPEIRAQQGQVNAAAAEFMKDTPMYEVYQRVAPRPEGIPRLLDKIGESMAKGFDYTEEFRSLRVPTLIVAADADMAPPSHYVEAFALLDGGLRDGGWMGEGRPQGGRAGPVWVLVWRGRRGVSRRSMPRCPRAVKDTAAAVAGSGEGDGDIGGAGTDNRPRERASRGPAAEPVDR